MYYIANQLLFLIKWIHINSDNEAWMDLEQYDCNDVKLSYLPFIGPSIKKHNCCKNKLISSTHLGGKLNITKYLMDPCIHSPIWYNPDFYIYKKNPLYFSKWSQCSITCLHHLFLDKFISFKDLKGTYYAPFYKM